MNSSIIQLNHYVSRVPFNIWYITHEMHVYLNSICKSRKENKNWKKRNIKKWWKQNKLDLVSCCLLLSPYGSVKKKAIDVTWLSITSRMSLTTCFSFILQFSVSFATNIIWIAFFKAGRRRTKTLFFTVYHSMVHSKVAIDFGQLSCWYLAHER